MARIYLSSTYSDLKDCRVLAYQALRKLGHDVVSMEDYGASDRRPLDKCLADVAACDIYVGVFAWRYGYVPPNETKAITELEYREARRLKKPCLIFLLDENAPWPKTQIDRESEKIETLREELKREHVVEFFKSCDELAADIGIAVANELRAAAPGAGARAASPPNNDDRENVREIVRVLKPVIIGIVGMLVVTVLAMVAFIAVPSIREGVDLKLALSGLGSLSALLLGSLMFIFNKSLSTLQKT